MKKRIIFTALVFILLFSSPVSASFLDSFFDWFKNIGGITGNVVSEEQVKEPIPISQEPVSTENIESNVLQEPLQSTGLTKEQVKCTFIGSDSMQKCYTEDGRFGCKWDGNVAEEQDGRRYAYCVAEVPGKLGEKLTWKSSCGGYSYSVIDGRNENVEFSCIPSAEVNQEQISGKGFLYAYWQCYDKEEGEVVSKSVACKSTEVWQEEARNFCYKHCESGEGSLIKCGVASFSLSGECYIGQEEDSVFITQQPVVEQENMEQVKEAIEPELICKDSCPLDGKCYPFGYRKEGNFCSDQGGFILQIGSDKNCENNFECKSNLCIDGKCISSSFINKVLGWFRGLFG